MSDEVPHCTTDNNAKYRGRDKHVTPVTVGRSFIRWLVGWAEIARVPELRFKKGKYREILVMQAIVSRPGILITFSFASQEYIDLFPGPSDTYNKILTGVNSCAAPRGPNMDT